MKYQIFNYKYAIALSIFLLMLLLGPKLLGQNNYRKFSTREVYQKLMQEDQDFVSKRDSIEQFTNTFKVRGNVKKVQIPVVFHILYSSKEERLSERQILSQLEALNRDFGKKDYKPKHRADVLQGFSKRAVDMLIEFCLAAEDPNGEKTSGITFSPILKDSWTVSDSMKSSLLGGVNPWDPTQYLNIWICDLNQSSGYAQMPGGPVRTDGIVIDYQYVGIGGSAIPPYDEGKTLTHLVGSYLNLFPLWGNGRCQDDGVEDTPIHNSPNLGCPGYKHLSACPGIPVEMTMNFMDNTNDACMYMFTSGQRLRMQATLTTGGPRAGLINNKVKCQKNPTLSNLNLLATNPDQVENNIEEVSFEEGLLSMKVFPNPANQEAFYKIYSPANGLGTLKILNANGGLQFEQKVELNKGIQEFRIDCKKWSNGLYLFVLTYDGIQKSQRLMVINNN